MGLTTDTVANMLNGVSQQPDALRSTSQCSEQINGVSSLTEGVTKRPAMEFVEELSWGSTAAIADIFVSEVERGPEESYILIADGNALVAFNRQTGVQSQFSIEGVLYSTLTINQVQTANSPREVFKAITVADTTFLLNRELVPYVEAAGSPRVTVTVQKFSDLPASPAANTIYKVQGTDAAAFSYYYVEFDGTNWQETHSRVSQGGFKNMPLMMTVNSQGVFIVSELPMIARQVGDEEVNPYPSFVNTAIQDVFFFRNRLGFITNTDVILSRSGEYYNFWRTTMTEISDSDPIDATITHSRNFVLNHAIPFNKALYLFGSTTQFKLSAGDVLSPRAFRVDPVSEYDCDDWVKPITVGKNIYFAQANGDYSRVREYFVESDLDETDAIDITGHCPRYIKGRIKTLRGSGTINELAVTTDYDDTVYVYRYFFKDRQRIQSSWSKYSFGGMDVNTRVAFYEGSTLNVIGYANKFFNVFLYKLEYEDTATDVTVGSAEPWDILLDHKVYATPTYVPSTNTSTFTLPYSRNAGARFKAFWKDNITGKVSVLPWDQPDFFLNNPQLPGPWENGVAICGFEYDHEYELSQIHLRDREGAAILQGRLQIKNMHLDLEGTGYFEVAYRRPSRDENVREWHHRNLGVSSIGVPTIGDKQIRASVKGNAKTLGVTFRNPSFYPSRLISYGWTGDYEAGPK